MKYILVEKRKFVILGPMFWQPRLIQSELNDLDILYRVPPIEQGYIKIDDNYEIFPITNSNMPNYDPIYDQLSGPFFTYTNNEATETYEILPLSDINVKTKLKEKLASERYQAETMGIIAVINNKNVFVPTDRENRKLFEGFLLNSDIALLYWKSSAGFVPLTRLDIVNINSLISQHVQNQFLWEKNKIDEIDAGKNIKDLKKIILDNPILKAQI